MEVSHTMPKQNVWLSIYMQKEKYGGNHGHRAWVSSVWVSGSD